MRGAIHICQSPAYRMGHRWYFEDHAYCGPLRLDKHGEPKDNGIFGEKHAFWGWYERWVAQGKRVDARGNCIVDWVSPLHSTPPREDS